MGVEHAEADRHNPPTLEKRRQVASVLDSIELVEYAATHLDAQHAEDVDQSGDPTGVAGVDGVTQLVLAEQRTTSASGPSIWALLLFSPLMTQLRCLDLSFNALDDKFWALWMPKDGKRTPGHDVETPALTVLTLSNNRFTSASVRAIAAFVAKCPRLRRLDLSLNPLGSVRKSAMLDEQCVSGNVDFRPLTPLLDALERQDTRDDLARGLEVIDLSCIGSWRQCCGRQNVELLERFMRALQTTHRSLRQLQMRSIALKDEHAAVIADALIAMPSLEVLELLGNEISDEGAARLAFVLDRAKNLQTLDLASNQITLKGIVVIQRTISVLHEPFALRHLHLERNIDIAPHELTRLHELLQAKVLERHLLSLPAEEATSIGVGDANEISQVDRALSLNGKVTAQSLALGSCLLGRHVRVVMGVLRTSHKWQTLRELDLSGNRIGATGAAAIALYLALHPSLRLLKLAENAMDGGMEVNVTLEEMDLSNNYITDSGATTLYLKAFSRTLDKRRRINVTNGNALTPECRLVLQSIAQAHDLRKCFDRDFAALEHLNLSGKMLRQYGARAIVDKLLATENPACSSLDLSRNALGDDGALVAAKLLRTYPRLEKLDLSFNHIGDAGAAVIADALVTNSTLQLLALRSAPDGSVARPRLTEAGLVRVAQALQTHRAIASVDLRSNVTSAGVTRALLDLVRANRSVQRVNGVSAAAFTAKHGDE